MNRSELLKHFGAKEEIEVDSITQRRIIDEDEGRGEIPVLKPEDFIDLRIVRGDVLRAEIWERNKDLLIDERENMVEMELLRRLDDDTLYLLGIYPDNHKLNDSIFEMVHPDAPDVTYWDLDFSNATSGEIRAYGCESD